MTILRIQHKQKNFVMLDKGYIDNPNLSLKAKGLLTILLAKPDNWQVKVNDLTKRSKDGREANYSALRELIDAGYITSDQSRADGKFSEKIYLVRETPQLTSTTCKNISHNLDSENGPGSSKAQVKSDVPPHPRKPYTEKPHTGKPYTGKPYTENPTLINNNINKNKYNKNQAAAIVCNELIASRAGQNAAAENFTNLQDMEIGSSLTRQQQLAIKQLVYKQLMQHRTIDDPKRMCDEISFVILDKESFKRAGDDFRKKLNFIKKCILNGNWQTPAGFAKANKAKYDLDSPEARAKKLLLEVSNLQGDCESLKRMIAFDPTSQNADKLRQFLAKNNDKLKALYQNLDKLKQQTNSVSTQGERR